jgi:glycosyltransferase involved in cell wall biosynthesis
MIIQSSKIVSAPLVSVIICTYNQEQYISQCIDSILAQETEFSYEIIIGEDCGTDSTRDICIEYQLRYPEKIALLLSEKNLGLLKNWFSCISIAKGKYIMNCAGDDFWHNQDKLQLQIDYMENNQQCGLLHTDYNELNPITKNTIYNYYKSKNIKIIEGDVQKEIFNGSLKICAPTVCIRKEVYDKYVPVDKFLELNFPIEDWPTNLIVSHYCNVNYLDISTVSYRYGHESISNPRTYEKTIDRFTREKQMYKYLCDMFPDDLTYNEAGYDIYVNGVLLSLAYKRSDARKAKEFAENMLKLGDKSMRTRMSANWFGFWIWWLIKKLK